MEEQEKPGSAYEEIQKLMREQARKYEDEFTLAQKLWEENCPGVDEVLEEYAKDVNGEIEKWREDTPLRILTWQKNHLYDGHPLSFSISMLLETKESSSLKIYAASWTDDEKKLKRYIMELDPFEVQVPTSRDFIGDVIKTYGHVLRIFNGGAENRNLMEEITNLRGPANIGIHFSQSNLSH